MQKNEFFFPSSDGKTKIHVIKWSPDDTSHIRGVIQISHGLNEQISMYEDIAKFFIDRHFVVCGNDHLGHGLSVSEGGTRLYFGRKGSWHYASDDIYALRNIIKKEYPSIPYIVLGFSLGSYLIRDYLIRYNESVDAAILVGCLYNTCVERFFGTLLSNILSIIYGDNKPSKLLNFIVNETPNNQFKDKKHGLAWLNENDEEIKRLMQDPYACLPITIGLFRELMSAVGFTTNVKNIKQMNKSIPILFISGKDDPIANKGKTIEKICSLYKKAGIKDVHTRLLNGRHRVFFDKDQEYSLLDIYDWACSKLNTEKSDMEDVLNEYDRYLSLAEKNQLSKSYERKSNTNDKEFFLRSVEGEKAILVSVEGHMNTFTAPKIIDYCDGFSNELTNRKLVLDLKNVTYIAEPGINALKTLQKKYGDKFAIVNLDENIKNQIK